MTQLASLFVWNFGEPRVLCCGHRRARVEHHPNVISTIVGLLECRRPATIARFIIAKRVLAVDAVIGARPAPHIADECPEGAKPATANGNPLGPVPPKSFGLFVKATVHHPAPNAVFGQKVRLMDRVAEKRIEHDWDGYAAFSFFGLALSHRAELQLGQSAGLSAERGNHLWSHRLHRHSVIVRAMVI